MSFDEMFASGFSRAAADDIERFVTRLHPSPEVELLVGSSVAGIPGYPTYPTYWDLRNAFDTYAVLSAEADYGDLMYGQPGYGGGSPAPGSGGTGLHLGITDALGVEWWATEVEGWESGPDIETKELESVGRGTWIDRVRGKGREVTIRGVVLAPGPTEMTPAKRLVAAALASEPHSAVMRVGGVGGLTLPVVLAEPVRLKQLGAAAAEFEMVLKGRDVGTPGAGVWREGASTEYALTTTDSLVLDPESWVVTRPEVRLSGPLPAGFRISDGSARHIELANEMLAGDLMFIDCGTWRVSLNGMPARYMVTPQSSKLEVGPGQTTITTTGSGAGSVRITVTEIY